MTFAEVPGKIDFLFWPSEAEIVYDESSWAKAFAPEWAAPLLDDVTAAYADVAWNADALKDSLEEAMADVRVEARQGAGARRASRSPDAPSGRRCSSRSKCSDATRRRVGWNSPGHVSDRGPTSGNERVVTDDFDPDRERRAEAQRLPRPPLDRGGRESAIGGRGLHPCLDRDGRPRSHAGRPGRRWRRRRRIWPRVLLVLAGVFAIVALYLLVTLWQVWSTGRSDEARPVDAIVVMGAAQYDGRPSPQLAARLDHVIDLWPEGDAPLVVVTGGNRPGDRFTEAEASAAYLEEAGIPESAILQEGEGTSSYESLEGVDALLEARGLDRVLIVTDPYHALRSKLIAEELGLTASVSPTPTSVVTGSKALERHLAEAAGVAVGRIIGFDRLDDLTD